MDKLVIRGGKPLRGRVDANGSKNAALPILIATLLTQEPCEIRNVPDLRDIRTTFKLLEHLGKRVAARGKTVVVTARGRLKTDAPYDLVKQMRASVLVAGPLLARFRRARVSLPGGCAIGLRPIDIHLKGFEKLGAEVHSEGGDILFKTSKLRAGRFKLPFPSVGATENLMMLAAGIVGETRLENAAREPEIEDLGEFLRAMGARVEGLGSSTIEIQGRDRLRGVGHDVIPDRIETGTLLLAAAAAGGDVEIERAEPSHLDAVLRELRTAGAKLEISPGRIRLMRRGPLKATRIVTAPYPGFPTDLQAPWMALMCLARGRSTIVEKIFEKRFLHAAELTRMGAVSRVRGEKAEVEGAGSLVGAPVMASDIRAGAALVVAGLAAKGETTISRVYHIDRGYERIEEKLSALGARIRRERE
jgi:UDP-N-acetylglucosamine 1-carboxyvinyltransferase